MNLNIGIVGAGGFAQFASTAFSKVTGIRIVAVTDINEAVAKQTAAAFDAAVYSDYETILKDKNINLVYIATPPFLHYEQSRAALLAGKHVICEKPAALQAAEAAELHSLARSLQLLYVVNLMQRYNPLYEVVKRIVNEELLGSFLHGFFENYASDEKLSPDHWFWDTSKSGGIFIEHGVHFFDMFSGWLGEGNVVCAVQLQRPNALTKIVDRVQATVLYKGGVVNFYHGFDQPGILDRQEMRLQFRRGEITLYEWIPVKLRLHGLLEKGELERLRELMRSPSVVCHNERQLTKQKVRGRFSEIVFDDHLTLEYGNVSEKQSRYEEMLAAMIVDQWNWIRDHKHVRVIDSSNAVRSLQMAEQATKMAQTF